MEQCGVKLIEASDKSEYESEASRLFQDGYRPSSDLKAEPYKFRYIGGDNQWHIEDRIRYIREFTKCA